MPALPGPLRRQYAAFAVLATAAATLTAALSRIDATPFRPYLLGFPPLLTIVLIALAATLGLRTLLSHGLRVWQPDTGLEGVAVAAAGATLMALPTVVLDIVVGFPEAINVSPRQAFLFYPAIGFVAEVVFHVLPLAVVGATIGVVHKSGRLTIPMAAGFILVATLEPLFQVVLPASRHQSPWLSGSVAVHLFVFNIVQLWLFRRYDLSTMFACRLVYYLHWHLVWGYLRLHLLF